MDTSPFSTLPRELRDTIYEYTFTSPYAVTLQSGLIEHPLTKTCVQVRHETLSLYYSLTRFNAHLDDGPVTPLGRWLERIGEEKTLGVEEVNVWDLHMLNATLHGTTATKRLLDRGTSDSKPYILQPIGSWYLNDIVLSLGSIGLGLSRFCIVDEEAEEGAKVKLTSEFAIVRRNPNVGEERRLNILEDEE